jgi:hypothetical protein
MYYTIYTTKPHDGGSLVHILPPASSAWPVVSATTHIRHAATPSSAIILSISHAGLHTGRLHSGRAVHVVSTIPFMASEIILCLHCSKITVRMIMTSATMGMIVIAFSFLGGIVAFSLAWHGLIVAFSLAWHGLIVAFSLAWHGLIVAFSLAWHGQMRWNGGRGLAHSRA